MTRTRFSGNRAKAPAGQKALVGLGLGWWTALPSGLAWAQSAPAAAASEGAAAELIPTGNLFDMLLAGGPLSVPIVLASFVMLLVVFERAISLRRRRVVPRLFVERF